MIMPSKYANIEHRRNLAKRMAKFSSEASDFRVVVTFEPYTFRSGRGEKPQSAAAAAANNYELHSQ